MLMSHRHLHNFGTSFILKKKGGYKHAKVKYSAGIPGGGVFTSKSGHGFTSICHCDSSGILRCFVQSVYKFVIATSDFRKGAVVRSTPARKLEPDVTPATTRIIQYDNTIQELNIQNTFENCNVDKILRKAGHFSEKSKIFEKVVKQVQDDTIRHCERSKAIQGKRFFGFYPQNDIEKKAAFTLAEVLITLGIIGIVAAMTMPSLIQKNNNKVVEARLKKFYSAMNQAVLMAENDYGDKKIWYQDLAGADTDEDGNAIEGTSEAEEWFKKYLAPYLKISKIESMKDGVSAGVLLIYFEDGSALRTARRDSTRDWDFIPGNVEKCIGKQKQAFEAWRDTRGKCNFPFNFNPSNTDETWKYHYNKGFEPYKYNWDGNLKTLYNDSSYGCNSTGGSSWRQYCTAIIQMNGWKIPDDYPFKVSY